MTKSGPDPRTLYPLEGHTRTVFLKNFITRKNIEVGDFTYFDDPDGAERFEDNNVLHHYDFIGDRLVIGRFCAIASGVRFIMNGANHAMDGFSTFPFNIFGKGWEKGFDPQSWINANRGDTVVGNDVWIGADSTVLPGITIGDGAIVASNSLVSKDVEPYTVVGGNPARVIKRRFEAPVIAALLDIAWWNWPVEAVTDHVDAIRGSDIDALANAAKQIS